MRTVHGVHRRVGWPARFAALAVIWGMSFVFIKVADERLAALQVAFGRVLAGALVLLAISGLRRVALPTGGRTWLHLAFAALLNNAVPFALFAAGEKHVPSVLAGIWNATTPLFALPVAVLVLPAERLDRRRGSGLAVGFLGVLVVLGVWRGLSGATLQGNLDCLLAAACYGVGFPYTRRYLTGRGDPLPLATGQLLCAAVELGLVVPLLTAAPGGLPWRVTASVVTLGVLGTGLAYILNYAVIRDAGATVASTVTYLIPVVSTAAGVALLGEPLRWNEPVGAVAVIVGALLTQGRRLTVPAPGRTARAWRRRRRREPRPGPCGP